MHADAAEVLADKVSRRRARRAGVEEIERSNVKLIPAVAEQPASAWESDDEWDGPGATPASVDKTNPVAVGKARSERIAKEEGFGNVKSFLDSLSPKKKSSNGRGERVAHLQTHDHRGRVMASVQGQRQRPPR